MYFFAFLGHLVRNEELDNNNIYWRCQHVRAFSYQMGHLWEGSLLRNVIDGPVMWLLTPPDGGWESSELIAMNKIALLPALIIVLRPDIVKFLR